MDKEFPRVKPIYWKVLLLLVMAVILAYTAVFSLRPDFRLRVNFYDVGQGDAAFFTTYKGTRVLIDGGPGSGIVQKLGADLPFFDRRIDLVVLTHPHADHVTGLIEVLKNYKVRNILFAGTTFESEIYDQFKQLAAQKQISEIIAKPGQKVFLDDATTLVILDPPVSDQSKDPNDSSVISRLSFGENDFLFLGDAGAKEESALLAFNPPLSAEVMKVSHHGSAQGTSKDLLTAVKPELAVISAGKNNQYHLPSDQVLKLLDAEKIRYLRTDEVGDIRLVSDGQSIRLLKNNWLFPSSEPLVE
jgi:competence protein ComEC